MMQLCCTLSETVCFELIHLCITNFRLHSKGSSQSATQVEKVSGFHASLVILAAVCRSLQMLKAKVIALDQRIDALQTTAASAIAATDHRVDTLQSSTENATQAAVSELRRVEHELSQCYALLNEFV